MLSYQRIFRFFTTLISIVIASLGSIAAISYLVRAGQGPVAARTPCGSTAVISNVSVTDVTSTTAAISWQTSLATESCLDLDSAIHPIFLSSQPISQTLQGVIYVPGEYDSYLDWVDRDLVTSTITSDVESIASANFNTIVLYPTEPSTLTIHPWDLVTLDAAAAQKLTIAFRLEWYEKSSFDWEPEDCDTILDHYDAYLAYFRANPGHLLYFLINMPLDDSDILDPNPTIGKQREYVAYCYDALKARVPEIAVYANTDYGWQDNQHQAAVGDLVDGVSVVIYAQHADDAPFDCNVIPTASHPASTLICKDQFDYYLDKAWAENNLAALGKPLALDQTGFAPATSYDDPDQKNGIAADSWAKVRAIAVLRRYLEQDARLYGWNYFKLLHKDEADWGLIDRRRTIDPTITATHQLTLTNLFPATPYTFTLQAGDTTSGVYTFTTSIALTQTNVSPLITIAGPPYGHELVPSGGQLTIAWEDNDPDDDATIGLYYDMDDAGCDGTIIADGRSEDSSTDIYTWTLPTTLPTDSYYIYSQIDDSTNPVECDYSSGRFVPSIATLEIVPARGAITVDGVIDEPIWQYAIPLTYAIHISQTDVTTATVRALWDQDYIYVGFAVEDTQVETANADWDDDSVSIAFNNGEFRCRQDVGGTGEGECERALHLPDCTTLDDPGDDCGYTVEMHIHWSKARITANAGDAIPTDFLSVDHDNGPGQPACGPPGPGCQFSKISWDSDSRVDTTGRSITLHTNPATLYVYGAMGSDTTDCTDHTSPCATIGYALGQAADGDTILVAMGTYTENLVITKTVTLKGGYEPIGWSQCLRHCTTTIDGSQSDRVIEVQSTLSETTVIDGFTITHGDGGISTLLSSVAIQNSKIVNNHCTGGGGGIRIDHSFVTITNTLVASNTAAFDGAIRIISTIAIPDPNSEVTITNSTIANNKAPERNGVFCSLSWCTVINSMVWGHEGEDFSGHNYQATYSDIEMGLPGEGNISEDPRFVDPASGDYHLQLDSPCIDAGNNEDAPETDFEGDRRPFDGDSDGSVVVDMGIDEVVLPFHLDHIPAYRPDLDWDGDVDVTDIMTVASVWHEERGKPDSKYCQYYDLRHDGRIDIVDIMLAVIHWGETVDIGPHFPLGYSPYRSGQAPGGSMPSPLEIGEDMEIIEQETKLIRTYGACDEELAVIPGIANWHGINVYQGVELTSTPSLNDDEMDCFATLVAEHQNIVAGVIGNETLLFDRLSESALVDYIEQAKVIGNAPVTTGEPWGVWCNEADTKPRCQGRALLGEAVDFILAYSYPYWENVPIDHGAAHVVATYITSRAVYTDRVVVIGETGWPTCGDPRDNAVPGLENQGRFIEELWQWANLYDIPVLYFEAFDEDWKVAEEGAVGRCWGVYNDDRTPKHDNLDWSIPTPEPTPTTPSVRIEHPRDIVTTVTKSNCGIPIFGRAYNTGPGWHVKVEVFTNQWYIQDKWYPDGLAPIIDDMWSMPEVILGGQGGFNNHSIRATLVDETGAPVASDEVTGIVRTNSCTP